MTNKRGYATISDTGSFVITERGRVGLVADVRGNHTLVQFGTDGPFNTFASHNLRAATEQEIKDAGLWGVGGNIVGVHIVDRRRARRA